MGKALTVLAIDKARPGAARREIPDGLLPGLYLIVQPTGAKSWAVRYRHRGRPRKYTIGPYPGVDLASARELARKALVAVANGRDPGKEKKDDRRGAVQAERDQIEVMVAQFVERYAKANTRKSTWRETVRIFNKEILPPWTGRAVSEITRRDVIELLDAVTNRGSAIMANRVLAAARRFFSWCVERDVINVSPCAGVKAPSAERSRDRILTDEELKLVWKAAEQTGWPFGPLVQLLILTGQRLTEVAGMTWHEVDLESRIWIIPRERTKNDTVHEVPLSDATLRILSALPRVAGKSSFVFTTNGRMPVSGFSRAKDRIDSAIRREQGDGAAPLSRWTFHDLRRTVASGMARLGVNLPVIEKVLNHSSGSFAGIVGVYQRHSFSDEKRIALQTWGRSVDSLVSSSLAHNRPKLEDS